ncbi:MAG: D-alanyl-D-alanine carboxypeptidase family protein [Cellulosilyticaceae bacterium]
MNRLMKRCLVIVFIYTFIVSTVYTTPLPDIVAEGAMLIEANTGQVLYSKNGTSTFYPASTTKVLTALLLLETFDTNAIITKTIDSVNQIPSDSSHIGLSVGESYNSIDGLYAILLGSDNFVSYDMSLHTAGSMNVFTNYMNIAARYAKALNSNFVNSHGYHDANHYTTPYDLARITKLAFDNTIIEKIAGTPSYNFKVINSDRTITLNNSAKILKPDSKYYNPHVVAAKTGFHTPAGRTLVAKALYDNIDLIAVVMKSTSPDFFEDINKLFDYGATNFITHTSNGNIVIENISYSDWSANIIKDGINSGKLPLSYRSYQELITPYDFNVLLNYLYNSPVILPPTYSLGPSRSILPLTHKKAQSILSSAASAQKLVLPTDFVSKQLQSIYSTVPTHLTIEDSIYIQHQFAIYAICHKKLLPIQIEELILSKIS